ncbi:MAG: hypothetical protein GTN76_01730 [Candidatus Aenigmarchaeota archaeon]|nr:hypothetical protein [Candidatus Aenigmarchaeota archaeon]
MDKYTETFPVTSSLGLHTRPSVDMAKTINRFIESGYLIDIEISSNGDYLHYNRKTDPAEPCDFTEMGLEMGSEFKVSVITAEGKGEKIFRGIDRILKKIYTRDEEDPSKSVLVHRKV